MGVGGGGGRGEGLGRGGGGVHSQNVMYSLLQINPPLVKNTGNIS